VHGLAAIAQGMNELVAGRAGLDTLQRLHRWAGQVEGRGGCRFPDGAVRLLRSALHVFEQDVAHHVRRAPCAASRAATRLPIPEVADGWR
jgi:NADH:ubiquinone oxidoreductase subunit F (NADH-binding)